MGMKIERIPLSIRRNANRRPARLLLGSTECPDDGFFFHIVHDFITDILPCRIACHGYAFRKQ